MRTVRFVLLIPLVVLYGLYSAQRKAASWDGTFSLLLAAVIVTWFLASQVLLRFIDRHNRSRKVYGFAGFLALLGAAVGVEWLVFRMKVEFGLAADSTASVVGDAGWLIVFPLLAYHVANRKERSSSLVDQPG
jgi:hypothetical protein